MNRNVFIDFHFYGSGNIGDDLVLDGFLQVFNQNFNLYSLITGNVNSQILRFPQIVFEKYDLEKRRERLRNADLIIGIGDTPFQISETNWMIRHMQECTKIEYAKIPKYLIGVGAEFEIVDIKKEIEQLLNSYRLIITRDKTTSNILKSCSETKILTGADLSHISLKSISCDNEVKHRKYDIGFSFADEKIHYKDLHVIKKFILDKQKYNKIAFFSNEIRISKNTEIGIYNSLFSKNFRNLFRSKIELPIYIPDYEKGSIRDLVNHFNNYDVVFTSRYHAAIAALWMGCKVIILGRKSSKTRELSKEFGIQYIEKPFSIEKLNEAYELCKKVERKLLLEKENEARKACEYFNHLIMTKNEN